jgi:hypothetical protein
MIKANNFEFSIFNADLSKIFAWRKSIRNLAFVPSHAIVLGLALSLLSAGAAKAAPLTTGADFLLMTTGARPDAMGQAFSAVADDINTLSFNPAGLGNIRIPQVGYGYESFVAGIQYDFVGAAIPFGQAGVLGLGYIDMGTAPFNSTANPAAVPVSAEDRAFVAGWGKSFYDFHVGIAAKYITRQLDTVTGNGWGIDAGVRYRPIPSVTVAASLMNLGPGIQLSSLEPLPTLVNTGVAWTAVEEPVHTLSFAANGAIAINTNTQQFGIGSEYWFYGKFALRAGYLFNSLDTNFNPDGFAAGAGVQVSFLQLDYAFQPFNTLGIVHRFSGMLSWEGPWVSGGEPNSPKYVNVHATPKALEIRWEKSLGPVDGYEVLIQPLDGRDMIISPPTINPIYSFKGYDPDTLYKISVRALGTGGMKSFPSKETYFVSPPEEQMEKQIASNTSISHGIEGKLDSFALRLSWEVPAGFSGQGFNIYRKSPSGQVEKVTQEPKHSNRVWMTDVTGLQGWEWIVTAVSKDAAKEKMVGTYLWYPTPGEMDTLIEKPVMRLNASPQADRSLYLDWDGNPEATGYALFYSRQSDNIFELFKEMDKPVPNALLQISEGHNRYYFIIVPKDNEGRWLKRSKEALAEFYTDEEDSQNSN